MTSFSELPRYPFEGRIIQGAPDVTGVYVLWEGSEITYVGLVPAIRQRLLDLWTGRCRCPCRPTHYSWRLAVAHGSVEQEMLGEYQNEFAALPRCNQPA
jgi:hypothetical protein